MNCPDKVLLLGKFGYFTGQATLVILLSCHITMCSIRMYAVFSGSQCAGDSWC